MIFSRKVVNYYEIELIRALACVKLTGACPPKHFYALIADWVVFLEIAKKNKAQSVLLHLIECPICKKLVPLFVCSEIKEIKKTFLLREIVYVKELGELSQFLTSNNLCAVLFKQYAGQKKRFFGLDIDILIPKKSIGILSEHLKKNLYKEVRFLPKEYVFIHPTSGISLDVHTLLAYPHYASLSPSNLKTITQLSKAILDTCSNRSKSGFKPLSLEMYLLVSAIRYWYNDLGQGIHSLFKIVDFMRIHENKIDYIKLKKLLHEYHITKLFYFIVSFGFLYFHQILPVKIERMFRSRIAEVLAYRMLPVMGVSGHTISEWHKKENKDEIDQYMRFFSISNLLLDEKNSVFRLARPRILILLTQGLIAKIFYNFR